MLHGGEISGAPGEPAFTLSLREPTALPILIAVPHAGRCYPAALRKAMRDPDYAALRLEDRYVDLIGQAVAEATGAALLVAHAPRAMIDLNRAPEEFDWDMLTPGQDRRGLGQPGPRVRSGLGLVPRRVPGLGDLWKQPLDPAELNQRLSAIHRPYHARLFDTLLSLRRRWGAALLIDLHSMPPLGPQGAKPSPQIVLGDRFGATCHGSLAAVAFAYLAAQRCPAAHNRPYAGGYGLERHAAPGEGLHALQLEIDRSCYLDAQLSEPGAGFDSTVELLIGLVRRLGDHVVALSLADNMKIWPQAAE
jgi:N-formylglutamate amidohydrolase